MHRLSQSKTDGQCHAFAAPSPLPRDWRGGPFPTHGELAQGLSLTMRPTRTASPLCFFSPQWPETWLSPCSCANILVRFEACFQKFGQMKELINKRFASFYLQCLPLLLREIEKTCVFSQKWLNWPPATYDVIYRNHSNWPSLNLSQNAYKG